MRNIILLLFFFTITSCQKKIETEIAQNVEVEKPEMTDKEFMKKLIKADFFNYAESTVNIQQIDSLNAYDENTNKFARIDAEELAEFSFDYFVPQLNKMLAKRNISLLVIKSKDIERTHEISINETKVILYSEMELRDGSFWNSAPGNFFRALNNILEERKIDERFYLINKGNDLSTLLLTKSQYQIFSKMYDAKPNEIPIKP